ncbi:MAG: hypothetical protein JWP28_1074, partial [Phenylobacterium sp.]|nr:hypothetical protein [Phenylobacterium sp.]
MRIITLAVAAMSLTAAACSKPAEKAADAAGTANAEAAAA